MKRKLILAAMATASGLLLWLAAQGFQSMLAPIMAGWPEWLRLTANAGGEETLRLALALGFALLGPRFGLRERDGLYLVLSSCAFAGLEHLAYIRAFPDTATLWRVGYAGPIHALAAGAYALALASPRESRAGATALALGAAWLWHALFNLAAAYLNPMLVAPAGTALNLAALAILFALTERSFYWRGYIDGRA